MGTVVQVHLVLGLLLLEQELPDHDAALRLLLDGLVVDGALHAGQFLVVLVELVHLGLGGRALVLSQCLQHREGPPCLSECLQH